MGVAGLIPNGTRFTFADSGDLYKHYVTSSDHNQIDQIVVDATSGNWTYTVNGQTTANNAFDISAVNLLAAIEALSNVAPGDVTVTLVTAGTYRVEFIGLLEGIAVTTSVTDVDLAGGGTTVVRTVVNPYTSTNRIYFTPALVTAQDLPDDNDVITFGGRTLEIKVGEGNLNYTEARTVEYILNRDRLDNVRLGADVPVDVSLDFIWEFLTARSTDALPTIEDAIKQRGLAAGWESTDADTCRPYAVDIEVEHTPPCGGEEPEIITLADFRWESLPHDLRGASIAMTGKCNVTEAIVNRVSA